MMDLSKYNGKHVSYTLENGRTGTGVVEEIWDWSGKYMYVVNVDDDKDHTDPTESITYVQEEHIVEVEEL